MPCAVGGRRPGAPVREGKEFPGVVVPCLDGLPAVEPDGAGTAGTRMVARRISG